MIPILFPSTETAFTSNGIGRLATCTRCEVTEERNGIFEAEFDVPITDKHYADIEIGCYILATHDDSKNPQPFEIYRASKPIDGVVTFNARHISYKLSNVILNPFVSETVQACMNALRSHSINANPFTFWTDKTTTATLTLEEPISIRSLFGGMRGSILDIYGGEFEFDKYTVKLWNHRGSNTGVTIRYGKNLSDLKHTLDGGEVYNAVVPFWIKENEGTVNLVMLDERIVTADGVENPKPVILDLSGEWNEAPTQAQMRTRAKNYLDANEPWIPQENIKIDFVNLAQTEEYKDIANLQNVNLCDTVNVYYKELGVTAQNVKIIKTVYDTLQDRYSEMELGEARTSFADTITAEINKSQSDTIRTMTGFMDAAIEYATSLITGGQGGHVVFGFNANGQPEEILIMDTESIETATNILRFNLGGIGFSTDGGETYSTAWTIDGHFNASFITAGVLNANLLRAGIITDSTGDNFWNLTTGQLRITGNTEVGDNLTLADFAQRAQTIVDVDVEYAKNQSTTTAPSSGWSTTSPQWEEGYYIWQRTKTVDGNATASYSTPVCIQGAKGETGDTGATGPQGAQGIGVSAIVEQYYLSTSSTSQTGGSWSTDQPAWVEGKYIWTRSKITWTNNTTTYTSPVLAKAINGANQSASDANDAVDALDASLTQQDIFNRLTNNGQTQGIYLENGLLYINATYIKSGVLKLGGANNINGTVEIYNSSAELTAKIDNTGFNQYGKYNNYPTQMTTSNGGIDFYSDGNQIFGMHPIIAVGITTQHSMQMLAYTPVLFTTPNGVTLEYAFQFMRPISATTIQATRLNSQYLTVTGQKSRLCETENYNDRLLYCYEMPSPIFGDIGDGITDENGVCLVSIDEVFSETVRTDLQYQVFLQKCGEGDLYIAERTPTYFIVKGTANLPFCWEIKGKQTGYETERLECKSREEAFDDDVIDFDSLETIYDTENQFIAEQEEMLYEVA